MIVDLPLMDCPAWLDDDGTRRCGLPAEVIVRYWLESSEGQVEHRKIRCPVGHLFNGPIESLSVPAIN